MTDQEIMYVSAVRYALGRRSYIVGLTVDFILSQDLSPKCKELIRRDVSEALERGDCGMDMDKKEWERLLLNIK